MYRIKCNICGQTLCKADVFKGEIKCPRCNQINYIEFIRKRRNEVKSQ
ncbi:Com family DNA-binding transcriptional regulator [uncultured Eubacterium sp.]|nr:MAG TPA: DNA-directed RNA polymerase [Caudoviricetes sp.]